MKIKKRPGGTYRPMHEVFPVTREEMEEESAVVRATSDTVPLQLARHYDKGLKGMYTKKELDQFKKYEPN
jgi:hypothetical protein